MMPVDGHARIRRTGGLSAQRRTSGTASVDGRRVRRGTDRDAHWWQCLALRPLPHGRGSLRPIFGVSRTMVVSAWNTRCEARCGSSR